MEEKDFNSLVNQLGSNLKCVLVLGPEFINIDAVEADFKESIHDFFAKKKFPEKSKGNYFSEDGFLQYDDFNESFDMLYNLSEFYKEQKLTASYEKLARIPFTSIISLSPDDLIVKAYEHINKPNTFRRYKSEGFEDAPSETSKTNTLIYNLAGHYDSPMDMIFTFDNFFNFLNKIFQDTVFPNFRKHIIEANSFLFLGFSYDKWYLKLIFFLLNKFRSNNQQFTRNAIFNYEITDEVFSSKINYYKTSFKMKFSPENEQDFIEKLYNACRTKGILSDIKPLQGAAAAGPQNRVDKYRILFLGASPVGKLVLRIGEEYYEIQKALKKEYYELLDPLFRVKSVDIMDAVNKDFPSLIYITCHGTPNGELILSDDVNSPIKLPLSDLIDIIKHLVNVHKQINCIVFSACNSAEQAKEISEVIPYCVGMSQAVDEEVSMTFTKGFFKGFIEDKKNIEYAFKNGTLAIKHSDDLQTRPFFNIPVLYKNGEICNP